MTYRYEVEFYDGRYRVVDTQDERRVIAWTYFRGTAITTVDALNERAREQGATA